MNKGKRQEAINILFLQGKARQDKRQEAVNILFLYELVKTGKKRQLTSCLGELMHVMEVAWTFNPVYDALWMTHVHS